MSILSTTLAYAAAAVLAGAPQEPQPEVTVYRSWRPPHGTLVEGMFRVDPELLGTGSCSYGVQFTVRDAQGNALKREQWDGQCPEQDGRLAAALETFQFAMPDTSDFTVLVEVYPQGQPDRKRSRTLQVRGLAREPLASDLILAKQVGYVEPADSGRWTFRHGTIGLQTSSQVLVEGENPSLSYYIELYPENNEAMTGTVHGVIRRPDGKELARFPIQQLQSLAEPRPLAGRIPVAGLAPGAYTFEAQVQLADTTIVRQHQFFVGGQAIAGSGLGWFGTLSDERLAELFDGATVWMTATEAERYEGLPPAARRAFLVRWFGTSEPTPDDGQESALDAYLARIAVVTERYAERSGRDGRPAWLTDRGRIYLMNGEPSATFNRANPEGGAPYEIWHYATGAGRAYVFVDETRIGNFRLVYSNDPNEKGVADWTRYLGPEAVNDLARLGIRPRDDRTIAPPPQLQD